MIFFKMRNAENSRILGVYFFGFKNFFSFFVTFFAFRDSKLV